MWKADRERCFATITRKVIPALQKLEEENDRVFDQARKLSEIWDDRRIRIPKQILAWTRD
mgnify:CR=1 FL=1